MSYRSVMSATRGSLGTTAAATLAGTLVILSGCASVNDIGLACQSYKALRPFPAQTAHLHGRDRAKQLAVLDARMHRRLKRGLPNDRDAAFVAFASILHAYTSAMSDYAATYSQDPSLRAIARQMLRERKGEMEMLCPLARESRFAPPGDPGSAAPSMSHGVASGPRLGLHEAARTQATFVEAALADLQVAVEQAETYRASGSDPSLRDRATKLVELYRADISLLSEWKQKHLDVWPVLLKPRYSGNDDRS